MSKDNQSEHEFQVSFFSLYKRGEGENNQIFPILPKVDVFSKKENQFFSKGYWEEAEITSAALSSLEMLHPQTRTFFTQSAKHYQLNKNLIDELKRTEWRAETPKLFLSHLESTLIHQNNKLLFSFKITGIRASLFPTGIIILHTTVEPAFFLEDETIAKEACKMFINCLHRTGGKRDYGNKKFKLLPIHRNFSNEKQVESVKNRFRIPDKENGLIAGLCGENIFFGDICSSLIEGYDYLLADRFLSYSLLKTTCSNIDNCFSNDDYKDLVRLSRGENNNYNPSSEACRHGNSGILNTFENVAFAHSAEGSICWIKPKKDQIFLQTQFKDRYSNIYFFLFSLAIHQKYALVYLAKKLDEATPDIEQIKKHSIKKIGAISKELRNIRTEVAEFYLRGFFQQPSSLTNHQEYYQTLQQVFGVKDLLEEVQQETRELEYIVSSLHEHKLEHEHEINEKNHMILALAAEFCAVPYYSYNFMSHGIHLSGGVSLTVAGALTAGIMGLTIFNSREQIFKFKKK